MALIKCVDCGKEVSDRAQNCPNCGCPIECSIAANNSKIENVENDTLTEQEKVVLNINETALQPKKQSFKGTLNNKKRLVALLVGVAVLVAVTILIVALASNGDANTSNKATVGASATTPTVKPTRTPVNTPVRTPVRTPIVTPFVPRIEYISDRTVDYDDANKQHRVFFGLKSEKNEYMSAESGVATIKIENTAGEVVYSKEVKFTSYDFSTWTNRYWDSSRLLACIYIKDSEITKGSSEKGTLSLSVVADNTSFSATTINIYDLPTKEITINLPSIPKTFTEYGYNNKKESTVSVDKITYSSNVYDYDDVTVTLVIQTTMTYNSTPGTAQYAYIGYKLKNSSGIIVDSGSILISKADKGDTVVTEKIFFGLNMKEAYTLELYDYKW